MMKFAFQEWLSVHEDTHLYANQPRVPWKLRPDRSIGKLATDYMTSRGMDHGELDIHYEPMDDKVGEELARTYDKLEHQPDSPEVQKAYAAFKKEMLDQFQHLLNAGYKFVPDNDAIGQGGGYAGAREMRDDVLKNKTIRVFVGGDLPPDHPLGELTPYTFGGHRFNYNELFRGIHDIFGHAHHGNNFDPRGEEHAYRLHSRMFSAEARPAMAAETRGQNSWVHYGPAKHIPLEDRPYAQQKAALMPDHLTGDVHYRKS